MKKRYRITETKHVDSILAILHIETFLQLYHDKRDHKNEQVYDVNKGYLDQIKVTKKRDPRNDDRTTLCMKSDLPTGYTISRSLYYAIKDSYEADHYNDPVFDTNHLINVLWYSMKPVETIGRSFNKNDCNNMRDDDYDLTLHLEEEFKKLDPRTLKLGENFIANEQIRKRIYDNHIEQAASLGTLSTKLLLTAMAHKPIKIISSPEGYGITVTI